jgi:hypothetical protein
MTSRVDWERDGKRAIVMISSIGRHGQTWEKGTLRGRAMEIATATV